MSNMINRNNIWVYEREGGDCGIVIAETREKALDELREVYTDIDKRLSEDGCEQNNWEYGLYVFNIDNIDQSENGNVLITMPY